MAKLELRNVKKSFGNLEIIKGVSIEIADGEFVVIVGPSGCGKSTLLRMVRLEAITSGEILIGERVVNNLEPKDRDIAMVFQNYALYPHMSVRQNMAYGLKIRGLPRTTSRRGCSARRKSSNWAICSRAGRASSPAGSASAWPWAAPSCATVGVPVRRAALEPGRQAAGADAPGDPEAAPQPGHHQRLCHPRPGRGDDPGRAHDRDECRAHRQIGTPAEVYQRPATQFVAGFIGSPAMNLLRGRADATGLALPDGGH